MNQKRIREYQPIKGTIFDSVVQNLVLWLLLQFYKHIPSPAVIFFFATMHPEWETSKLTTQQLSTLDTTGRGQAVIIQCVATVASFSSL